MERDGKKSGEVKLTFRVYPQQKEKFNSLAKKQGVSCNTYFKNLIDKQK